MEVTLLNGCLNFNWTGQLSIAVCT